MKYYKCFLILLFIISCKSNETDQYKKLSLDLSRKDLTKLFKGQELYSIRGVKTNFDSLKVRVRAIKSKKEKVLALDVNKNFYLGSNEIILHSDLNIFKVNQKLQDFIKKNKITWMNIDIAEIQFKNKLSKEFVLVDVPNKENIEFNRNRFLQIFNYNNQIDIEESDLLSNPNYKKCFTYDYSSLVVLFVFLEETKIKLNSFNAIKVIPNPITNRLHFLIDFNEVTKSKNGITYKDYINQISNYIPYDQSKFNSALKKYQKTNKEKQYKEVILSGVVNLQEDIKLSNVKLIVQKGTQILLHNNAKIIIEKGIVNFLGEKDTPIIVKSVGNGFNSLKISNIDTANFKHVQFDGLSNISNSCENIPSAITVYNSKSNFEYCQFKNNKRGDDIINLFHSSFSFKNCNFINVLSDAIDSDFSKGTVASCTFNTIGNDAVDCSGSNLKVNKSTFINVKDKAVSAGENSTINVSESIIKESAIGFVAKDGSKLLIKENNVLINNDLDFAIFAKKTFYAKPSLTFNGLLENYKYLIEKKSTIITEDKSLVYTKSVESKLYGNEYGKSSK